METATSSAPAAGPAPWLRWSALAVLSLAVLSELTQVVASRRAAQASAALNANRPAVAREWAERALAWDGSHPRATFTRVMALRALQQPAAVAEAAEAAARWHPQRTLLLLISGEARLNLNHPVEASRDLWAGLWAAPIPAENPAAFWRNAWLASVQVAGARSGEARAARHMLAAVLPLDTRLTPAQRTQLLRELQPIPPH